MTRAAAFRRTGQVPPGSRYRAAEGVTIATDAAINFRLHRAGLGFITTSGQFGLSAHPQPRDIIGASAAIVAELRSIWRAVSILQDGDQPFPRITILTDSDDALRHLRAWKKGNVSMFPAGYQLEHQRLSGNRSSLEKLAEVMAESGDLYAVRKVTGHAGDPLNEAADSLAKLALRTGSRNGLTPAEAVAAAERIAEFRLQDYWKAAS